MYLLVDTETTDLVDGRIVEIAIGYMGDIENMSDIMIVSETFNPPTLITTKAMSVHGITNEMTEGLPEFIDSGTYNDIVSNNSEDNVFVAHNAPYDLGVLKNEGIENKMVVIDTLKCCRHIFKDMPTVETNLQFLKYHLALYKEDIPESIKEIATKNAHSAAGDVLTLYLLFRRLVKKYGVEKLISMTNSDVIYNIMPFGKHKGEQISDIVAKDKSYMTWIFSKCDDQDVVASFKCHAKKK